MQILQDMNLIHSQDIDSSLYWARARLQSAPESKTHYSRKRGQGIDKRKSQFCRLLSTAVTVQSFQSSPESASLYIRDLLVMTSLYIRDRVEITFLFNKL
jgi:hypothetical protein